MSALPKPYITPEQYLATERKAEYKSEYYDGEMFAMAGTSARHSLIVNSIVRVVGNQFVGRQGTTYSSDLRVQVNESGLYTYPDFIALCGAPSFTDTEFDTLLNPTVIVEVLSPSTEHYDHVQKFAHYRKIESLTDYIMVAQDRMHVEHYVRQDDGHWLFSEADGPEGILSLESVGCTLVLSAIYDKVEFELPDEAENESGSLSLT